MRNVFGRLCQNAYKAEKTEKVVGRVSFLCLFLLYGFWHDLQTACVHKLLFSGQEIRGASIEIALVSFGNFNSQAGRRL